MKNSLLVAAALSLVSLSASAGASGLTAERLPQLSPGFTASQPFPNRTVALDQVDSQYLFMEEMIFDREIAAEVDDTINEDDFYSSITGLAGRSAPSVSDKFYHYEQGYIYRSVKVGAVVTTGAAQATITLADSSYSSVGSMKGTINRSPLKVTDVVMFAGRLWGYVVAKTGSGLSTQYTIKRRDGSTEDIGAAIAGHLAADQAFAVPTNAQQQASGPPDEGMDTLATRFEGTMQQIRNVARITGDADAAVMHVMLRGQKRYYNKMAIECAKKQRMDVAFANMFSPGGTFTNASGNLVQLNTGLEGYIMNLGQNYYYQRSSGFTILQMREVADKAKALSGCREFIWECGPSQSADIDNFLATRVSAVAGGLTYNTFGIGDNKQRAIDLGFTTFKIFDLVFHKHETRAFQHPEVTGLPGMNYDACGFLIPGDKVSINRMADGEFKRGPIQSLTARYKVSSKGQSRRWIEWENDRTTNGGFDIFTWNVQSQEGFQMAGARRFMRIQGY